MEELESSLHLFQPPMYHGKDGNWRRSFQATVERCGSHLTWDDAAVLSMLSLGYVCGDRTLVREIRRRSWLSAIGSDGECRLQKIPPHDTVWKRPKAIAQEFCRRLCDELTRACEGREQVYVLLSGGLDSRVVAGTAARLYEQGRIEAKPIAVTWGLPDSRDRAYGRAAAAVLGLESIGLDLRPEHLIENITATAESLGALVSPAHLHRMTWFKEVSPEALVLGASYGDMVGRAEFSKKRVLELRPQVVENVLGLMSPTAAAIAREGMESDLAALRSRAPGPPEYVHCEHEQGGHYMRGLIAQAMSVIGHYCKIYQAFTAPEVYGYMWSIHPSLRFDDVYAILLEKLNPGLARLPWARTNQALRGRTKGALGNLKRESHQYEAWIAGPLYDRLSAMVDPDWFGRTGLFEPDRIRTLSKIVKGGPDAEARLYGSRVFELWVWLACFRRFAEGLERMGKRISLDQSEALNVVGETSAVPTDRAGTFRRWVRSKPFVFKVAAGIRRAALKHRARLLYPPKRGGDDVPPTA